MEEDATEEPAGGHPSSSPAASSGAAAPAAAPPRPREGEIEDHRSKRIRLLELERAPEALAPFLGRVPAEQLRLTTGRVRRLIGDIEGGQRIAEMGAQPPEDEEGP